MLALGQPENQSTSASRHVAPVRRTLLYLLAAAFLIAGYFHIAHPDPFLRITPAWVPVPRVTIFATGICELLGAAGLLIPSLRRTAGIMLALYSVCVFPANIQHAVLFAEHGIGWTGWLYHGPRLLFQPLIVWWCLFAGQLIDWPFIRIDPAGQSLADPPPPHPRSTPKA